MRLLSYLDLPGRANPSAAGTGLLRFFSTSGDRPAFIAPDGSTGRMDNTVTHVFSRSGTIAVATGTHRLPILADGVIESVAAMVGTAPSSTVTLDVNKNGTTIYGTQANRPSFAASANAATVGAHSVTTVAAGDYLTVDIDAGTTGADLVVAVAIRRTP